MKTAALLLLLALPAAAAEGGGDEAQKVRSAELTKHYDAAFQSYSKGEYSRAIMEWREVLRKAPDQATAEKMIGMAREAIDARDKVRQDLVYAKVSSGDYQGAMVALQPLLEGDPLHPHYTLLQARLDRISFIVPQVSTPTKAWAAAVRGMSHYVAREDDLPLAYDALRWARELDPKEPLFGRLIAVLLADNPALAQDAVSPGMGILEYKRFLALNLIYDGKYPQAAALLEKIVSLDPEDATALKRLGSACFAMKDKVRAKAFWTRALELRPDDKQLKEFLSRVELPQPQKE